tara:strand:- start:189 stop:677 length:489 start_codon:yes stop_codon:yes gene_type:complete
MSDLTQDLLHELFEYRDGDLIWKGSTGGNAAAGKIAGTANAEDYRRIAVNRKLYQAHRLVFLMHHGHLPRFIDHIDNDPRNNRIENLRPATNGQNQWNQAIASHNTSGFKGVSWNKRKKKWYARVYKDDKCHFGGYHENAEEANEAAIALREKLHGEFVRHE